MTLYRLNQVPDRLYVKFLELVGVELFSAVPARADLLFTLTAPRDEPVRVPAGTQVSTERRDDEEPVVFLTDSELRVTPPQAGRLPDPHRRPVRRPLGGAAPRGVARCGSSRPCARTRRSTSDSPSRPAGNLLRLDVTTGPEGAGVDPRRPPRVWEAWDGQRVALRCGSSTTPAPASTAPARSPCCCRPGTRPLAIGPKRAYWLRCRLVRAGRGRSRSTATRRSWSRCPRSALGGAVPAHHAEPAPAELLGASTGRPGQVFQVRRVPVLPRRHDETVKVVAAPARAHRRAGGAGVDRGRRPGRRRPPTTGCSPGPAPPARSGSGRGCWTGEGRVWQHGAIPAIDAQIYVTGYRFGGGRRGNVAADRLTVLHTSIPFVGLGHQPRPRAPAGWTPRPWRTPRSAGRCCCAAGAARSPPRTSSGSPWTPRPAWPGPGACRRPSPGEPARLLVVPRVDIAPEALTLDDLRAPRGARGADQGLPGAAAAADHAAAHRGAALSGRQGGRRGAGRRRACAPRRSGSGPSAPSTST